MRRHPFGACGTCLTPAAIARRIRDVCLGNSQPLILEQDQFSLELYAQESCGSYLLHLGDPDGEPDYPTLREFIEDRGFSLDNRRSARLVSKFPMHRWREMRIQAGSIASSAHELWPAR